jgi:hypothetical protein
MPFLLADFHLLLHLTRLGEMQVLVPAALIAIWRMYRDAGARPLAAWRMLTLAVSTLITTATKVAVHWLGRG